MYWSLISCLDKVMFGLIGFAVLCISLGVPVQENLRSGRRSTCAGEFQEWTEENLRRGISELDGVLLCRKMKPIQCGASEPVIKHQKVIKKGKKSIDIGEPRRVNQKNMTSHVQIGGEVGENEYEKLRDSNMRRNAMVLKTLGLPPFESSRKERTTSKTNIETTDDAPSEEANTETSPFQTAHCWRCKLRLMSSAYSYCSYCGARQSAGATESHLQVQGSGGAEGHLLVQDSTRAEGRLLVQGSGGAESQGKLFSSHSSDSQVNGPSISDRQLSYERVFHPRPRHMADNKQLWGKQFLKKYYPRQHEKLNLIHGDVRHWFSNTKDPLVDEFFKHPSIRQDGPFLKRLLDFVKAREPELATLVFIEESITMRWKVDDIMKYAFEIKHYKRKRS